MITKRLRNYKRAFVVILAVAVALLHFVIGPNYKGALRNFLTGYLIDILLPFFLYFLFTLNINQTKQKIAVGAGIIVFGTGIEYLQYRGVGIFGSTFDPYDFVAYFVGVVSATLFDLIVWNKIMCKKAFGIIPASLLKYRVEGFPDRNENVCILLGQFTGKNDDHIQFRNQIKGLPSVSERGHVLSFLFFS